MMLHGPSYETPKDPDEELRLLRLENRVHHLQTHLQTCALTDLQIYALAFKLQIIIWWVASCAMPTPHERTMAAIAMWVSVAVALGLLIWDIVAKMRAQKRYWAAGGK